MFQFVEDTKLVSIMAAEIYVSSVDGAAPRRATELPSQSAATAPAGSTGLLGWIAATAQAVGGACLHLLKSPAGGALILASVCLVLTYKKKKARRSPPPPQLARSMSLAMLQGGDKAMQRFRVMTRASTAQLSTAIEDMRWELQQPLLNFVKLYANVGIVELSGKEKEAIELLEDALKKAKKQPAWEHTHDAHELELLLVEMYIYKGDYDKALDFPCLKRDDISSADARAPLYRVGRLISSDSGNFQIQYELLLGSQAVIYILKEDEKRARENYDRLKEVWSIFHGKKFFKESPFLSLQVPDFAEFAEVVKHLKQEIQQSYSTAKAQDPSKPVEQEKKIKDTATPSSSEDKKK